MWSQELQSFKFTYWFWGFFVRFLQKECTQACEWGWGPWRGAQAEEERES